jgi:uncharacterized damage-inducible protein DinB
MIDVAFVRRMARYNRWQNQNLYGAAAGLGEAERQRACGAFFGSIQGTLSHLLWADRMWMSRFAGTPPPEGGIPQSAALYQDWEVLRRDRAAFDDDIIAWADAFDPAWLDGDLTWYSGAAKREITKPKSVLLTHFFNHQTHHRGQVHCLLTQAGAKPGDTDLPMLPE